MSPTQPSHCVAVIGGAVAGAEVAGALAERGIEVVVFEQGRRPSARSKTAAALARRAAREGVRDDRREALAAERVVRARTRKSGATSASASSPISGASRASCSRMARGATARCRSTAPTLRRPRPDLPEPVHHLVQPLGETRLRRPTFEPKDGALVVGRRLASIDVVKVLMLETTRAKLRERGIDARPGRDGGEGHPEDAREARAPLRGARLEGCTLFYRRSEADMPLMEMPDGADEKRREKVYAGGRRCSRRRWRSTGSGSSRTVCRTASSSRNGQLVGLRFRADADRATSVIPLDETFERRGVYTISSIGSVPKEIPGSR
jgi:hypothetical protein